MRVVVAPDSFKGSVDAVDAAEAIATGWLAERPGDTVLTLPQADGGEGTCAAVERAVGGAQRRTAGTVTGPDGRPVEAWWLELPDGTAVVELAVSSGLPLMAVPDPLRATTRGLGEVMRAALEGGATRLVVGLGGSASTDGAAGALAALGARWLDSAGRTLPDGGMHLVALAHADLADLVPPPPLGVEVLVDVEQPLFGPRGAAAVFGPQKGASPEQVVLLDRGLRRFAEMLGGDPDEPGTGAAGGAGFGLARGWGARLVPGARRIAELSGLDAALTRADLLITGEGRFDRTSLQGKVVGNALGLAEAAGVPVAVVAGLVDPGVSARAPTCELATLAGDAQESLRRPHPHLRAAGADLARRLPRR